MSEAPAIPRIPRSIDEDASRNINIKLSSVFWPSRFHGVETDRGDVNFIFGVVNNMESTKFKSSFVRQAMRSYAKLCRFADWTSAGRECSALQTQHHAAIATTGHLMAADGCFCFAS